MQKNSLIAILELHYTYVKCKSAQIVIFYIYVMINVIPSVENPFIFLCYVNIVTNSILDFTNCIDS